MVVLVNPFSRVDEWKRVLPTLLPGETLRWWPDVGDPADIELLVAWRLPRSVAAECTNLAAILSLGAGIEQWTRQGMPHVPIVRLEDPAMADEMSAYVLAWVIRHQRQFAQCEVDQRARRWQRPASVPMADFRVGILGHGAIGARMGRAFRDLGFPVNGWKRTAADVPGVTMFAGREQLLDFLAASDAVVNVLPSTDETTGLLTRRHLEAMPPGSLFVNVGRGTVLADERALLEVLDGGPLAAAVLDVTEPEPPDAASPLFDHPGVTLTAHLAGATRVPTAARLIAANIERIRRGDEPYPLVDRARGY